MDFHHNSSTVRLHGILPPSSTELREISADHMFKSYKGNDIWAMAMVKQVVDHSVLDFVTLPSCIQQFL